MADNVTNNVISTTVEINSTQAQQELVKLNAIATNSTKSLEERIIAKNKAVEIQNALSKKTIDALTNERRTLEGKGASEKELMAIKVKLDKANLDAIKTSEANKKALDQLKASQEKFNQAAKDGEDPLKNLDDATGGLLEKFTLFLKNPIGIAITALVGLFNLFKEAIGRNEKATESLNIIISKFTGIINGVLAVVGKLAEFLLNDLLKAINNPKQAVLDFGNAIKENFINRLTSFLVLGRAVVDFFQGDFKKSLKGVTDGVIQLTTGVEKATDKLSKVGTSVASTYSKSAEATERLANATKKLEKNQVLLEQSDLRSKKLAEDQRQIRDDTSKSFAQRIEANKKLGSILDQQLKKEKALGLETLRIEQERVKAFGSTSENIANVNAARTKLLEIEERIGGQRSEQLVNQNSLLKEQSDSAKQASANRLKAVEDQKGAAKKVSEAERQVFNDRLQLEQLKLDKRRAHGENVLDLELKLLEKREKFELEAEDLIQSKKDLIKESYKQSREILTKQGQDRIIENEILLEELEIKRKQAHGENVLQLELDLSEKKKQLELTAFGTTEEEKRIIKESYRQNEEILIAEDAARKLSDQIAFDEQDLAARRLRGENIYALERQLREDARKQELSDLSLSQEARAAINKKFDTANASARKAEIQKDLDAAAEAFGISQELKIAQLIMNAPTAVANSFTKASEVYPAPLSLAMGAIGAAGIIVPIVKGLSDIKKTRFPGKKKPSSSSGTISTSGITGGASVGSANISDIAINNAARVGVDPSLSNAATSKAASNIGGSSKVSVSFSENKYNEFQQQVKFKEEKTSI